MDRKVTQVHHGSGDNIVGDKSVNTTVNKTTDKKNYKEEIIIGIIVLITGALILGLLKAYNIFPFNQ